MVSDDIFKMEELPKTMGVIGGGYIAFEQAMLLHSLGVDVTLFYRYIPLRFLDDDLAYNLMRELKRVGIKVVKMGGEVQKVTKAKNGNV